MVRFAILIFLWPAYLVDQTGGLLPAARALARNQYRFFSSQLGLLEPPAPLEPLEPPDAPGEAKIERRAARALARRKSGCFNILYYSPVPTHPSDHGNRRTVLNFAKIFQDLGHTLHFGLMEDCGYTQDDLAAMRSTWDFLHLMPSCPGPIFPEGVPFDGWYGEKLGRAAARICRERDIDVVFCSYVWHSKMLEQLPENILKIIDTHDRMSGRFEMLRAHNLPLEFFSCTAEDEAAYLRRADIVTARRAEEADFFNSLTGDNRAVVLAHLEPPAPVRKCFRSVVHIGLVASENLINYGAVRDFLKTLSRHPEARSAGFIVHIAGRVANFVPGHPEDASLFKGESVDLAGFVEDIGAFYAAMDLIVAPVMVGTGINVKTVEAMSYGLPLLATACAGKGIETGDACHGCQSVEALVDSLFALRGNGEELERLAALSRRRYAEFYETNMESLRRLFNHEKLTRA